MPPPRQLETITPATIDQPQTRRKQPHVILSRSKSTDLVQQLWLASSLREAEMQRISEGEQTINVLIQLAAGEMMGAHIDLFEGGHAVIRSIDAGGALHRSGLARVDDEIRAINGELISVHGSVAKVLQLLRTTKVEDRQLVQNEAVSLELRLIRTSSNSSSSF